MDTTSVNSFNQQMRDRTLAYAVNIYNLFRNKEVDFLSRSMVTQILRSSSSVAANCSAAARSRSDAEYYSKICIVVEECDETKFWLDYLEKTGLLNQTESISIRREAEELVKIFSVIKKKLRDKNQKRK